MAVLKQEFELPAEGSHRAVFVDFRELGLLPSKWGEKPTVDLVFELEEEDSQGHRFIIHRKCNRSLSSKPIKSNLVKILEVLIGREWTLEDKYAGVETDELLGRPCNVEVIHNIGSAGGKFANVKEITEPGDNSSVIGRRDYERGKDGDDDDND